MKKITINAKTHIIKTRKLWNINPVERTVASKKNYSSSLSLLSLWICSSSTT